MWASFFIGLLVGLLISVWHENLEYGDLFKPESAELEDETK